MFKPLRVGSAIAAKPTFAIESPNRYANEPVIPFATLMAFLGTKPVNDTPLIIADQRLTHLMQTMKC